MILRRIAAIVVGAALTGCSFDAPAPTPAPKAVSLDAVRIAADAVHDPDLERAVVASEPPRSAPDAEPSSAPAADAPTELNLDIPFYPQAPFADWSMPYQEACEEASVLLIANAYFDHNWSRDAFRDEILKLVAWEVEQFGAYEHTDAAQTAEMLRAYLGLESRTIESPTFADVQDTLRRGHLLVGLFAGRELGNPFYSGDGPLYHAMVVKGFTETSVVTHDVGTKRGADYVYPWTTFQSALHEWAEPIQDGRAMLLEVLPPVR